MKDDFHNYLPTVMFRGTPCKNILNKKRMKIYKEKTASGTGYYNF